MSWNFGSKKKAAILAAVLGGCLMGQVAWAAEFDTAITGGTDAAYAAAGVKNGETYALAEDTVIRINVVKDGTLSPDTGAVLLSGRNNIDIMMGSHNLTMDVSGDNSYLKGIHQGFSGGGNISVEGTGLLTIDVKDGSMRSHGIATGATGQSVTVHAPLKATVGSRRESYGVSLGSGSTVSLLGDTDITVNKNASLSAALYAERTGGTINVNYVDGAIGSADTKVVLNGDIYSRRVRDDYDYNEFNTVNIGLSGSDSVWNGISGYRAEEEEDYDSFDVTIYEEGVVNLALQNGAVWNNEAYGTGNKDVGWNGYKGSRVTTLTGGADAGSAGIIFQKDGKPLTIGKLAGTVTLLYAHEGDGSAVENYTAGDTTVKAAEDGAHLVMITDSTGIATDDKEKVAGALNAMAQKFYYPAKDGKLTGQAKIAEGLTAVSATKGVGDMDFGGEKGQASVKPETVKLGEEEAPVPPVETSGPITGPETLNADREITWSDSMSSQNKKISAFYTEAASSKAQPMVVDLNGHNLTIHAESHDPVATALYVGNNAYLDVLNGDPDKKFSITATNTDTRGANGIYVEGNAHFKITGAVDIEKVETKNDSATGIAFQGQDSEGLMTGPVYIHNVEGLKGRGAGINNSGILMTGERSKLEIAGPVYITDIKGAALKNRGGGTVLSVGGGEIRAAEDTDKSKNYAAARVEQGTMNINMVDGHAGSTTTKITGDMYITGTHGQRVAEYSNGQLVDWAKPGHLNVALTDKDSFWKGAATYDKYRSDYGSDGGYTAHDVGEFRLDLKNGALWTNELQSHGTTTTIDKGEDYAGSRLKTLNGGTKEAPGYIYQKEALPIKVENYSGSTVVCYDHDAANPSDVKGGEFHIAHAEEDSNITLRTDNQGLDTTSQTEEAKGKVNSALNALAQKLYYSDYIKGDKTLTGTVEIAEGLTATSAFFTGPITFIADVDTELNGQGSYVPKEEAVEGGPISAPEVLQTARISKGTAPNANDGYVVSGLYSEAESPADNPMVVDLNGHDLTVAAESTSTMADGVFVGKDRNIHIKNGGENDFIITASNTGGNANGIRFGGNNSSIVVDGPVTIDGVKAGKRSANGVGMNFGPASATFNGPLTITNVEAAGDSTGVQTYGIYANATGAKVVVTGPLNISNVKGSAVGAARQGAEVFTAGGRITAVADPDKRYFAVRAANGTINMNVEGAANHIAPSSLVITGDIEVGGQGVANINLPDAKSSWTGIVSNRNKMNLTLQNGATWTTKRHSFVVDDMNELKVTSLKGGEDKDTAGIIRPEDSRTVVIGDYSGNAVIYYPHTAEATSTMIGADVKIAKAAPGSHVILRTGNEGLDTESENPQSNQAVTAALKALANKFWYTGFVNEAEKDNLTGTVEIAEGLTSRSALRSGRLGFIAGTGQGDYSSRMEIKNKFSSTIYGIEEKDQEYVDSGVRQADGTYKFTDDAVISTKDANATADKISYYRAVAGIVGNGNDVTVTSGDKTLRLQQVAGDRSYQALGVYANKKVDITAGLLDINETSSGSDAIGILAHEGGEVAIHGDVRIRAYHTGDGNSKGMNLYNKGAKIIIDGDMDMGGKEGSGEGIYGVRSKEKGGYGSVKSYQAVGVNIYDRNGAELVVKGDAYIGVKGTGVDMRGSANNKVTLAGGKIITPMEGGVYKAASIAAGHFTMGMNEARNAVNGKAVEIAGNIYRGDDADIVIGLGTADSSWSGVVYDHNSRGEGTGVIKLYLANGGTWNFDNVSYADNINYVPVARLVGGSDMEHAGVLFPKQQEDLRITRFEGNLAIIYPHDAMAPQFVNGGDVHILGAEADSHVRMITDSDGLNTASGEAAEKEKVKNTLNALAGKLYYENYHAGERNLTGTVEIAEGLTAASAKLTGGDITFKDEDGQGQYIAAEEPVPEVPAWSTVTIDGDEGTDSPYVQAGIFQDGKYNFSEDAVLHNDSNSTMIRVYKNVDIDMNGHDLEINNDSDGGYSVQHMEYGQVLDIKAKTLKINTNVEQEYELSGIYVGSFSEDTSSVANIHSDVEITATNGGRDKARGISSHGNAVVTIDGDVKMNKGEGWAVGSKTGKDSYYNGSAAIHAGESGDCGGQVLVKGGIDLKVRANGLYAEKAGAKITVQGGRIEVDPENAGGFAALRAEGGTVNMNVKTTGDTVTGAGDEDVTILGNICVSTGHLQNPLDKALETKVNLGLNNADSSFTGTVYNAFPAEGKNQGGKLFKGEANLWLANGATWNNEAHGEHVKPWYGKDFAGSRVGNLHGGEDESKAGMIFQKHDMDITVDNYSGFTKVFYEHEAAAAPATTMRAAAAAPATVPVTFKGGDITIKKAAAGSGITLVTDNTGITMSDEDSVNATLNALAGKLFYTAHITGEANLAGKVEIAEGLTASSASQRVENITFKDEDGQGQYIAAEEPVADYHTVPITGDAAEDADPSQKPYVQAGILKDGVYTFTEDTTLTAVDTDNIIDMQENIVINAAGHVLMLTQEDHDEAVNLIEGQGNNVKLEITADKLVLENHSKDSRTDAIHLFSGSESERPEMVLNGNLEVSATNRGENCVGIYAAGNSGITINGNVTMHKEDGWAVDSNNGGFGYYGCEAIYATSNMGMNTMGANIVVNGDIDLKVNGNGLFVNAGGATIDANGDVYVEINKKNRRGYMAVRAEDGTVNVNVKREDGKVVGAGDHKVVLKGNVGATTGATHFFDTRGTLTQANIGLATADSSLEGVVYNAFPEAGVVSHNPMEDTDVTFFGEVNMVLANGATWTNVEYGRTGESENGNDFEGSRVTNFIGGASADKAGVIFQKDENPVEIGNYSGFTKVFYEHEEAAPATTMRAAAAAPVTFKGGDITIKKAAAGSGITLVTDNTGITMSDEDSVNATLNALAGKLFYTAHTTGEENLAGKVEIAEGLTASSVSVRLEDITYKDENGQGQYIAPVVPEPEPEKDFHNVPITGNTAEDADPSQKPFVKEGILKDGVYTFDKDTTLAAKDADSVVAPQENVTINAAGHTLTMNQEGHEGGVNLISDGIGKKVEITADKVVLDDRAGGRTDAIHMFSKDENAKSELVVNGDLDVTAINSKDNANGIYAAGNAAVTVNGNVKMNNGDEWAVDSHESGYGYYGASGIYSTSNMGPDGMGAKVVVNGDVDLKVNGNGMYTNAGGSTIDTKGDVAVEVKKDNTKGYAALRAEDGVVNVNVVKDGSGKVTGADSHKVNLKGNVAVTTGAVNSVDKKGTLSAVNLGLSTPDSSLHGVVYNAFKDEGKESNGVTFIGESNLVLENGATWTNEQYGPAGESWGGEAFAGSKVTNFTGGASEDKAGFILQKEETPLKLRSYKGFTKVAYEHDVDSPTTIKGGDVEIGKAAAGSGITLMTDNAGLNTASKAEADKKLVTDTLTALAGKLKYEAYKTGEKNLAGKVEIAEGLTASSASLDTRDIVFTDEGVGTLAKGEEPGGGEVEPGGGETPGGGEIEYGDKETVMMRGAKTALASSAMVWRNTNSDLQQRLGDVRLGREDVGIWAKYKGGKLSMDTQKTDLDAKYNSFSVGFDKEIGDNWLVGGAISHLTGDGTYREGTGDLKQTDFTAYGTRVTEDGQYLDLVAKAGQLKNDFHVVNEMGHKLDGDYKANGVSFSVEYGKRFVQDNGFYIDPSVQFTVGRIGGKDFDAASDFKDGKGGFKSMHIQQDAFTSSVGRLGLTVGQQADNYNAFAKMVLAHEFSGAFDTAFSAEGEAQGSKTHLDLKDTWFELEVGGSAKISESSYLYGSFARSMGGDVTNKWRVDAGVRFSF